MGSKDAIQQGNCRSVIAMDRRMMMQQMMLAQNPGKPSARIRLMAGPVHRVIDGITRDESGKA